MCQLTTWLGSSFLGQSLLPGCGLLGTPTTPSHALSPGLGWKHGQPGSQEPLFHLILTMAGYSSVGAPC